MSIPSNKKAADSKSKAIVEKDKTTKASKPEKDHQIPYVHSVAHVSTNSKGFNRPLSPHIQKQSKPLDVTKVDLFNELGLASEEDESRIQPDNTSTHSDVPEAIFDDTQVVAKETSVSLSAGTLTQSSDMAPLDLNQISCEWQDMDFKITTSRQMSQIIESGLVIELMAFMNEPIFELLNTELDLPKKDRSKLLKDHCNFMIETLECYITEEDAIIIASIPNLSHHCIMP